MMVVCCDLTRGKMGVKLAGRVGIGMRGVLGESALGG